MEEFVQLINDAFSRDDGINEVGFFADPTNSNSLILEDHKLGLPFHVLKPLYKYCHLQLSGLNKNMHLGPELCREIDSITRGILLVRGDSPIAYQWRKRLMEAGAVDINRELNLLAALFMAHPKSPAGWEHRRYCIRLLLRQSKCDIVPVNRLRTELNLCETMGEIYAKNYYSWLYRLWLLDYMPASALVTELQFTEEWMDRHVSDHTCTNHREQVIQRILSHEATLSVTGVDESIPYERYFNVIEALICRRPGSETLWLHLRNLMTLHARLLERSSSSPDGLCCCLCRKEDIEIFMSAIGSNRKHEGSVNCLMCVLKRELSFVVTRGILPHVLQVVLPESGQINETILEAAAPEPCLYNRELQTLYAWRYLVHVVYSIILVYERIDTICNPFEKPLVVLKMLLRSFSSQLELLDQYRRCWTYLKKLGGAVTHD